MLNFLKKFQKNVDEPGIESMLKRVGSSTVTCKGCGKEVKSSELLKNMIICPECGKYFRISARNRVTMISDKNAFKEMCTGIKSVDFLKFPKYEEKLKSAESTTGEDDAVVCGITKINGIKCAVFSMDSRFMMASMGSALGEKITRIFEYATANNLPLIGFTASGGARMQEGIVSLMQMAKVSGAVKRHSNSGNLYITVLTDPTTGGCTASFAMQGDIILAEPNALIGFAGRRVIEQTTKEQLPDNFQSSEFLLEHGFVDAIVTRDKLRQTLYNILSIHTKKVGKAI